MDIATSGNKFYLLNSLHFDLEGGWTILSDVAETHDLKNIGQGQGGMKRRDNLRAELSKEMNSGQRPVTMKNHVPGVVY